MAAFHGGASRRLLRYRPLLQLGSQIPSSLFTTLTAESQLEHINFNPNHSSSLDERFVLHQLSDLLPIQISPPKQSDPNKLKNPVPNSRAVDAFLLPEEKLRGVFLQKLKGISVIEHALDNAGVDLSSEVVAQVVNRGSLGGDAMLVFFNWAIRNPNVGNHVYLYRVIIKALGRRKFFNCMMQVLSDMRKRGVCVDLETVSIVMDSFVRAGHVGKAIRVFRELEEFGLECSTECLNVLLQCLCRRSHVVAASSFLSSVKGKVEFSGATYNVVIGGWSRYGRVSEMERTLEAMVDDGFSPDSATFSYILEGLGRAGRNDDAVEIFESMEGKGCVPDTGAYNAMISNFISVGNIYEYVKYFKTMSSNGCDPDMDTYTKLIAGLLKT